MQAEAAGSLARLQAAHEALLAPSLEPVQGVVLGLKRFAKRVVRKLVGWYVEPRSAAQREFNAEAIRCANLAMETTRQLSDHLLSTEYATDVIRWFKPQFAVELAALREQSAEQADLSRRLLTRVNASGVEIERLADQLPALYERVGVHSAGPVGFDYAAFEARFRGDRATITANQRHYAAQFGPPDASGIVADIGCGRGEMVEILIAVGHDAVGIDSDADMIAQCEGLELPVVRANGLTWLDEQEPGSLKGVFCAQMVEHLVVSELERFVEAALRALRPGGILIVETINPRSLFALANHFFADVTHVRPVHPETLRFICEQAGFRETLLEERSLHPMMLRHGLDSTEQTGAAGDDVINLIRTVFGFQDYALKAIK
ncbi:MAG: methyltransferase domain-containing protein [Actinobacteria bacterium]|nr:methyltransferase domain-containing protein [Actinomycetota bacterium]